MIPSVGMPSTTKQRSWKADGFECPDNGLGRRWGVRLGPDFSGGRGRNTKSSGLDAMVSARLLGRGTTMAEVAGTDLYVAVVKTTEKVLLKQPDASQVELEHYLSTGANRSICRWL